MDFQGRVQWTYSSMDFQGRVQWTYRVEFQVDRVLEGSGIFTVLHEGQQVSAALLPFLGIRWGLPTLPPAASALAALHRQDSCNNFIRSWWDRPAQTGQLQYTSSNRTTVIHFIKQDSCNTLYQTGQLQ